MTNRDEEEAHQTALPTTPLDEATNPLPEPLPNFEKEEEATPPFDLTSFLQE